MTKRAMHKRAAIDYSELLNNKRPDIDAILISDIMESDPNQESDEILPESNHSGNPDDPHDMTS